VDIDKSVLSPFLPFPSPKGVMRHHPHRKTPVQGLNAAELRRLRKLHDTGSEIVEGFRRVLEDYTGGAIDDTRLKTSISKVLRGTVSSSIMDRTQFLQPEKEA
jgi:hypothetical protein